MKRVTFLILLVVMSLGVMHSALAQEARVGRDEPTTRTMETVVARPEPEMDFGLSFGNHGETADNDDDDGNDVPLEGPEWWGPVLDLQCNGSWWVEVDDDGMVINGGCNEQAS